MILNLIFKRVVNGRTEMRVIPTEINCLTENDGWVLASSANSIEFVNPDNTSISTECNICTTTHSEPEQESIINIDNKEIKEVNTKNIKKLMGLDSSGSSKLVRTKGRIFITKRRPSDTQGAHCIFISDACRVDFFKTIREAHGNPTCEYSLYQDNFGYAHWNDWMDEAWRLINHK